MQSTGNSAGRQKSLLRSEILQVCVGLFLAILLFQADRMISGPGNTNPLPHAAANRDAVAVGIRIVRLECDAIVEVLDRVVRIDTSPCRFITISK